MYKCYACYQPSEHSAIHKECCRSMFGRDSIPELKTTLEEIETFAQSFIKERVAVTGVQKKLSLYLEDRAPERFTIVGTLQGNYILKPPSPEYDQLPELEDVTMNMAKEIGLVTAAHSLIPMADGVLAFIVKRFDRVSGRKKAQEDACQLAQLTTERKYRSSHEKLGKIIKKYSSYPGDDALKLFEVAIFSFLTGNADMHLKNFSLLEEKPGKYRLSPAYDLVPTRLLLSSREDPEELALSLNGKKNKLTLEDFYSLGTTMSISQKAMNNALSKIEKRLGPMNEWIEKSFLSESKKQTYLDLIQSRAHRLF